MTVADPASRRCSLFHKDTIRPNRTVVARVRPSTGFGVTRTQQLYRLRKLCDVDDLRNHHRKSMTCGVHEVG